MVALIIFTVLPFIAIVIALVFMKFYKLDSKAMEQVQARISEMKDADLEELDKKLG